MPAVAALVALASAATPVAVDPSQAAGNALMACVRHAAAMTPIDAGNADALATAGLAYSAATPAKLASMSRTAYGTASFAQAPSTEGDIWAVGYDRGTCMVMVLGTAVEPIEARLAALFAIPGTWQQQPIAQPDEASRWTQYGWRANGHHLVAQVKAQPLSATPIKGLVMVTVARDTKKN